MFPEKLANGEKYIAEAAAHECGHTLGLHHDGTTSGDGYYSGHGTGETGWASIMGAGYYSNLTQWSKGEYSLANNTEDDLAIINRKGCLYRADDYPDASAGAPRVGSGTSLSASGLIEESGDSDVMSFSAGSGPLSITVSPATLGANLDVAIELRNEQGAIVASANPVDAISASLSVSVAAGTYYLSVAGTGKGDPLATGYTNYGSLGTWRLSGTVVNPGASVAPVAALSASPSRGVAPLPVSFDGSVSYDPDGSISSWTWDFGDGTSGSGAQVAHVYGQAGTYHAVLTVTDNGGLSSTAATDITVEIPNLAPTASFWASASSGYAPLAVTFDGSDSGDPEGAIVSWGWDFGDGTTGSGVVVDHTYAQTGTYTAKLTVTDNGGAKATSQLAVRVAPAPTVAIYVDSITIATASVRGGKSAKASVRILDSTGKVVPGALVTGVWGGAVNGTTSAVTGTDGIAVLNSKTFKKTGTISLTVTQVSKTGYIYDPGQNVMTKASVALASVRLRQLKR